MTPQLYPQDREKTILENLFVLAFIYLFLLFLLLFWAYCDLVGNIKEGASSEPIKTHGNNTFKPVAASEQAYPYHPSLERTYNVEPSKTQFVSKLNKEIR